MTTILLSIFIFGIAMLIMAVGVIFKRPCLRGSCGGPEVLDANGQSLSCATCPNKNKNKKNREECEAPGLPVIQ